MKSPLCIASSGFKYSPLLGCVEYAEAMAKFYGGLNDAANHRYWVKVWWQVQCAVDGIATEDLAEAALLEWEHYQSQRASG